MVYGLKVGYKSGKIETSLNYSRITADGRYLMPREWGRDPLFTFLPRERNEGFGDVHAILGKINYTLVPERFTLGLGLGHYQLPDVKTQGSTNMVCHPTRRLTWKSGIFSGLLEGLDVQYLLASKFNAGETYSNDKYVINKVEMQVHNLVLNFHF